MDDFHDKISLLMKGYHDLMSYIEDYQTGLMPPKEIADEEPFDEDSGPMAPAFSPRLSYESQDLNAYDSIYNHGAPLGIPMAVLVRFSNSDMLKPDMGDEE